MTPLQLDEHDVLLAKGAIYAVLELVWRILRDPDATYHNCPYLKTVSDAVWNVVRFSDFPTRQEIEQELVP